MGAPLDKRCCSHPTVRLRNQRYYISLIYQIRKGVI